MPSLKGRSPTSAYQELLKISNQGAGLDGTLRNIEDGAGNPTGIQIGTGMVAIFGYQFPSSGFASGKVLRVNATNNAFEWHSIASTDISGLSTIATSGHYSDLTGTPTIPTSLSQLSNDSGFTTAAAMQTLYGAGAYSLPTATASVLGGIKLGTGLTSVSGVVSANVTTVAGRTGAVVLSTTDISGISSYATLASPALSGVPTTPTALAGTNNTQVASTAFVAAAIPSKVSQLANDSAYVTASTAPVVSVAGRTGTIALAVADVSGAAPTANPALTGSPTAPTATAGTNTTQIATTAFVATAITAATPTKVSQLTNDSGFVIPANEKIQSVAGRTGTIVLSTTDISGIGAYAPLASPTFTGAPLVPTATAGTNTTQAASTAFVASAITTALPTKISQLTNDSAFITSAGAPVQTVAGRTGVVVLSTTDISGITNYAPLASPALTGSPTAPTQTTSDNSTKIATTSFVKSAIPVQSVAGRTGAVTIAASDVSGLAAVATSGDFNDLVNTPIYNFDGGDATTNTLFYQIVNIDGGTK